MFYNRTTVFEVFGFKVKADASWIFLGVLIAWSLSTQIFPADFPGYTQDIYQYMGIAGLAGLILSILVHELAHAIIAEYYNMPIASITLFIFGGVAEMKGPPSHAKGEFLMAIAGPIMSFLMGIFFWASGITYETYKGAGAIPDLLGYLALLNLMIAIFNIVPAFPLDGGRALRAVIWHYNKNLVKATRITTELGIAFAYGLMGLSLYRIVFFNELFSGIWIGLLGMFVLGSSKYAVRQTESRSLLQGEKVSRFLKTDFVAVTPDLTITRLVDEYIFEHYQRAFPVVEREQLIGIITLQSVISIDRNKWPWLHVLSVMDTVTPGSVISPDMEAADALEMMHRKGLEQVMVVNPADRSLVGILYLKDMASYVAVSMKVDQDKAAQLSSLRAGP